RRCGRLRPPAEARQRLCGGAGQTQATPLLRGAAPLQLPATGPQPRQDALLPLPGDSRNEDPSTTSRPREEPAGLRQELVGEEVRDDQVELARARRRRAGEEAHARAEGVARAVLARHEDGVRVDVEADREPRAQRRRGEREAPGSGANVEDAAAVERLLLERLEREARRRVTAGAERAGGGNPQGDALLRGLRRGKSVAVARIDPQAPSHRERL